MGVDKDYTFDAQYVQQPEHKLLYRGKLFSAGIAVDSVVDDASVKILINARTLALTALLSWAFGGNGHVHFWEVNSWTAGSAINLFNHWTKYQGVNSISGLLIQDPTSINVQVSSTSLLDLFEPGGTKSKASGGPGGVGESFIIGPGDTILIELVNHAGTGASIGFGVVLHETPIASLDEGI